MMISNNLYKAIAMALLILPAIGLTNPSILHANEADPMTTHDPWLYLFFDDHWIGESTGLTRILNHPQPLPEPIISPDNPQTERECAWGNMIREPDGRYRIWVFWSPR